MPPVTLTILVDDSKGTPQIRVFDKAIQDTTKTVEQSNKATGQASQSTQAYGTSLGTSAKSALTFAGTLTGVQLGISAISSAVQGAVTQVVDFQAAMANVNTLGVRSAEVQQQLRTQLLQLPPVLGSATELAQGLYEVLSSGVEPAKAVQFLGEAAALAKAGLAQLDTSVVALTKTMAAYNIPAEKAGEISDLLFKTVEIGQGSLQQFAGAMPQVVQIAASMGISLKDASNAMATLSQTFKSADTAATGFRSLLAQVIQNNDKFLALGINIKRVISEEGLLGLVRVLQQVSQGDTGKLKEYVNDIEGLNAAVALTGPQFQTLIKNQKEFENATGAVDRAVKIQAASLKESFGALVNALGQLANDVAPPFLTAFARIAQGAATTVTDTRQALKDLPKIAREALEDVQQEAEKFRQATKSKPWISFTEEDLGMATLKEFFRALAQGADSLSMTSSAFRKARDEQVAATTAAGQWRDETVRGTAALAAETAGLAESAEERKQAAQAQRQWRDETERNTAALALLKKPIDDANAAMQGFNKGLEELRTGGARSAQDLQTRFTALRDNLETMARTGVLSAEEVRNAYEKMAEALRAQFGKLPPVLQDAYDTFVTGARQSASGIEQAFKNLGIQTRADLQKLAADALADFQTIERAGTATPEALLDAWLEVVDKIDKGAFKTLPAGFQESSQRMQEIARKLGVELPKPIVDAFGQIEFAGKKAAETIDTSWLQSRGALERARGTVEELREEVVRLSEETQKLMDLQIAAEQQFASDVPGLLKQLAQAQQEINKIQSSPFGDSAAKLTQVETLLKEIAAITEKLKALGVDQFGQPLPGKDSSPTATGPGTLTGTPTSAPTSPATSPGSRPGTPISPTAPILVQRPGVPTSPTNSLLLGGGPGGGGQTPGFPVIGTTVSPLDSVTQRGVTVNVTLNAQMLTADRATLQQAVNIMAPAINEAIRRGAITV